MYVKDNGIELIGEVKMRQYQGVLRHVEKQKFQHLFRNNEFNSHQPVPLKLRRIFAHHFIKQFIKIGEALKTYRIAGFGYILSRHQQVFGDIYTVLVYKIGKGDIGLALKVAAKSGRGEVHLAGHHVYIGLAVVIGIDVFINGTHAYLIL